MGTNLNTDSSELSRVELQFEKTGESMVRQAINNNHARLTEQILNSLNRSGPVVCMMLRRARQRGSKTKEGVSFE